MKTVRNITQSPLGLLAICSLLFFFSCGRNEVSRSTSQYSGKELMKAIYFMNGDAVTLIEPLNNFRLDRTFSSKQVAEIDSYVSNFLDSFEKANPGSFDSFKIQMTSGDHSIIGQAMDAHAKAILTHLNKISASEPSIAITSESRLPRIFDDQPNQKEASGPLQDESSNKDFGSFKGLALQLDKRNEAELFSGLKGATNIIYIYQLSSFVLDVADGATAWTMWEDGKWIAKIESDKNNLMREQIINSVASNWEGV